MRTTEKIDFLKAANSESDATMEIVIMAMKETMKVVKDAVSTIVTMDLAVAMRCVRHQLQFYVISLLEFFVVLILIIAC